MNPVPPPAQPQTSGDVTTGIGIMLVGMLLFAANDALAKWLVGGFLLGQVLVLRSLAGLACVAPFLLRPGGAPFRRMRRPWLQLVRALLSALDVALFYRALRDLPLADAIAIYMAAPIYVTAVSPFLLGERVGWRRWTAVGIGFAGVLLALGPGLAGPSIGLVCAVIGSFAYALYLVATRALAGTHATTLAATQLAAALAVGAVMVAAQGWAAAGPIELLLLAMLGVGSLAGHVCVNRALRLAPASIVVPYQYTSIVWGVAFGAAFFGEVMDTRMAAGTALIIGAGLFIFLREQQLRRHGLR